jgi:2Fe-2S ferredoxin
LSLRRSNVEKCISGLGNRAARGHRSPFEGWSIVDNERMRTQAMARVTFIESDGSEKVVEARNGSSLMDTAVQNGITGILADCGGACTCATCHVYVDPRWLDATGEPAALEKEMLTLAVEPEANSRLSCQIRISDALDGLVVRIPDSQF